MYGSSYSPNLTVITGISIGEANFVALPEPILSGDSAL
jgi:hypothetical protein